MRFHDLEQQKTSLPVDNVLALRCGCSMLGATAPLNQPDEPKLPPVTPNVRAKRATAAGHAGQQAQNGPQAQRLMAGVACRWRSA